jgi:hypothetical protein
MVRFDGSGIGRVVIGSHTCDADCTFQGTGTVTLNAVANSTSGFSGWSGACSGTGTCTLSLDNDRVVTATFRVVKQLRLKVELVGDGRGHVRSDPPGIDCPGSCEMIAPQRTKVTLVPMPDFLSTFDYWFGTCFGTDGCTFTLDADSEVLASFRPPVQVGVTMMGAGSGRVVSDPPGIDCPGTCLMMAALGSTVSLTAEAGAASTFAGWRSGCTADGPCTVSVNSETSIWANFAAEAAPEACAKIAPPSTPATESFVHVMERYFYACQSGSGDADGTLAFPRTYGDPDAHGSGIDFVTSEDVLDAGEMSSDSGPRLAQQPGGFLAWGDCGHLCPWRALEIEAWDSAGHAEGTALRGIEWTDGHDVLYAADPAGGLLLAADMSGSTPPFTSEPFTHAAAMYVRGASGPSLRWGPIPLATAGTLLAAGVDVRGRALVISDGTAKFGPGTVAGQWLERDGSAITGEFVVLDSWKPAPRTRLETAPLIGGGLVVLRRDSDGQPATTSQALVTLASGHASAEPAPEWMRSRPNTRLQIIRGGHAYALLPYGSMGVRCSQTAGVVAPDGTWCASADYPIAPGTCDTSDLTLGADGTVIQQLPFSMETSNDSTNSHSCTWRWWRAAME